MNMSIDPVVVSLKECFVAKSSLDKIKSFSIFDSILAYRLMKISEEVNKVAEKIEKLRVSLIKEIGTEITKTEIDKDGQEIIVGTGEYKIEEKNIDEFRNKFSALLEETEELLVKKINLSSFSNVKSEIATMDFFEGIEPFVIDDVV